MKMTKYMRSNKKLVIGLLLLVILVHASGIMERLLGMKKKSEDEEGTLIQFLLENTEKLREGAKGDKQKPPSKEDMDKLRKKNIKDMQKMMKQVEKEAGKMKKREKLYGVTRKEKELTLKLLDYWIETFEKGTQLTIFRGKPNNKGEYSAAWTGFNTGFKALISAMTYANAKMDGLYGAPAKKITKKQYNKDKKSEYYQIDMGMIFIKRLKEIRRLVASIKPIDG